MTSPIPEDMTELVDANIDRIDIVGKAANGHRFIMAKGAESPAMFSADDMRATLAALVKADDAPDAETDPDAVDLTQTVVDPVAGVPGDPTDPGSPAWEAIDAATACKWMAVLGRAMNGIDALAGREAMEDTAGGDYDGATWDLQDACSALDYAMSVLAPYAVGEAQDSQYGAEAVDAIGKAVGELEPFLTVTEGLASITKSGRSLSAANETALRNAAAAIEKVLASLPPAPEDAPVEKEAAAMAETTAVHTPAAPVTKADPADAAAGLQAVFDADGKLVGVCDPANIQPITGATAAPAAAPAAEPAAADAGNAQAPNDMTKSADIEGIIRKAVEDATAPLLKQIDTLEHMPMPTGALLAGHNPGTATAGTPSGEGLNREDMRKQVAGLSDPGDKMLGIAEIIKRVQRGE